MAHRFEPSRILDVNLPTAFAFISGAISGTTPKVSSWIRLIGVDTFSPALSTTGTANGVWTAEVATGSNGQNAKALPDPPAFPTGAASSGTPVITMPGGEFVYLRITFTPSAGAGNANANAGLIVSRGAWCGLIRQLGLHITGPSTNTLAGTHVLEASGNYDGTYDVIAGGPKRSTLSNIPSDPAFFTDLQQSGASPITAMVTGGQNLLVRCGLFEFSGIRWQFTPTSGFGTVRIWANGKS